MSVTPTHGSCRLKSKQKRSDHQPWSPHFLTSNVTRASLPAPLTGLPHQSGLWPSNSEGEHTLPPAAFARLQVRAWGTGSYTITFDFSKLLTCLQMEARTRVSTVKGHTANGAGPSLQQPELDTQRFIAWKVCCWFAISAVRQHAAGTATIPPRAVWKTRLPLASLLTHAHKCPQGTSAF